MNREDTLTEARIREIVREELAAVEAERPRAAALRSWAQLRDQLDDAEFDTHLRAFNERYPDHAIDAAELPPVNSGPRAEGPANRPFPESARSAGAGHE